MKGDIVSTWLPETLALSSHVSNPTALILPCCKEVQPIPLKETTLTGPKAPGRKTEASTPLALLLFQLQPLSECDHMRHPMLKPPV